MRHIGYLIRGIFLVLGFSGLMIGTILLGNFLWEQYTQNYFYEVNRYVGLIVLLILCYWMGRPWKEA